MSIERDVQSASASARRAEGAARVARLAEALAEATIEGWIDQLREQPIGPEVLVTLDHLRAARRRVRDAGRTVEAAAAERRAAAATLSMARLTLELRDA